jgi:hypothetical protein
MSQVTNLAFFRARRGQSEALGAALAALVEPTRLEAGCLNYDLHRLVDAGLVSYLLSDNSIYSTGTAHSVDAASRQPVALSGGIAKNRAWR